MEDRRQGNRRKEEIEETSVMASLRAELFKQGINAGQVSRNDLVPFAILTHLAKCDKSSQDVHDKLNSISNDKGDGKLDKMSEVLDDILTIKKIAKWGIGLMPVIVGAFEIYRALH